MLKKGLWSNASEPHTMGSWLAIPFLPCSVKFIDSRSCWLAVEPVKTIEKLSKILDYSAIHEKYRLRGRWFELVVSFSGSTFVGQYSIKTAMFSPVHPWKRPVFFTRAIWSSHQTHCQVTHGWPFDWTSHISVKKILLLFNTNSKHLNSLLVVDVMCKMIFSYFNKV